MEPHSPEYSGAESPEEKDRRKKEKEKRRLLKAILKWKESRTTEGEPPQTESSSEEAAEAEDSEDRKGKVLHKVLRFLIPRAESEPGVQQYTAENYETPPRFQRVRRVTNQILTRVVETHDAVRAVVGEVSSLETESLQAAETDLRQASAQFETALYQRSSEGQLGAVEPGAETSLRTGALPIAERGPVRLASSSQRTASPTITRAATASLFGMQPQQQERSLWSAPENAAPNEDTLSQQEQALEYMQQERINYHDSLLRQQRVQETVDLARRQAEVVDQATQALQRERPVGNEQRFTAPSPLPPLERTTPPPATSEQQTASYEAILAQPLKQPEHSVSTIASAEAAPTSPATKEAPTEQQISDRIERAPGRDWSASAGNATAQHGADSGAPVWQVPSDTSARIDPEQIRNAHRRPPPSQPQNTHWLAAAVLVIVVIGLIFLSLTI